MADPVVHDEHRPGAGAAARLSATTWWLLALNLASCFGSGLTKPFLIVYLHDVRGVGLAPSGVLLASIGVAGLVTMPVAGIVIDRIGPFKTFAIGQVIGGAGTATYIPAHTPVTLLLACLMIGVSGGLTTNGLTTLLAVVVLAGQRGAAYGLAYTSHNLGIGAGAAAAGLVLVAGFANFPVVFLADAVSFLVFAAALLVFERLAGPRARHRPRSGGGYRTVLADRGLLMVSALGALLTTAALSQTTAAIPAVAVGTMGVPTSVVGAAFAVNAVVLTACQFPVIRLSTRYRRSRMTAGSAVVFGVFWFLLLGGTAGHTVPPALLLIVALALFAVAEALLAPTLPVVTNDLAPDELRGRYNAVFNMSGQVGMIAGPALAGWLLAAGPASLLLGSLAALCLFACMAVIWAGRHLPRAADRPATTEEGALRAAP
jgi:MFS family permease